MVHLLLISTRQRLKPTGHATWALLAKALRGVIWVAAGCLLASWTGGLALGQSIKSAHKSNTAPVSADVAAQTSASDSLASDSSAASRSWPKLEARPVSFIEGGGELGLAQPLQLDPVGQADLQPVVPTPEQIDASAGEQSPSQVSGHTVGCQAACCWPLAKLLEQRARTLLTDARDTHSATQRSAQLQASFLRHQAAAQRDLAAGLALRAYYSWIANRQQLQFVEEGLELQREQQSVQASLVEKGVAIADVTALERKRLELEDNRVQLTLAEKQLASGLARLTCCQTDLRCCATESLDLQPQTIDCSALIQFALQHRHDYVAINQLCHCLDEDTAVSIAQLLTPLIGVGIEMIDLNLIERLCLKHHGAELLAQVKRELRLASEVWRTRIEQAVCEKCQALQAAYERVTIAEAMIQSWETRIAALQRLGELGDARGEALTTARAELISARSTLVTRQLAAKLAEVELAEAVGDLALRCCHGQPWLVR